MTVQRHAFLSLSLLVLLPLAARAQSPNTRAKTSDCSTLPTRAGREDCTDANLETRTVYLNHVTNQNDANELLVAVRNMFDPSLKVYLMTNQNAIVLATYPAELDRVEAFIHALDRPHKTYRITYTIAVMDDGKNVGTQHYSMVVIEGQRTTMKEGDKVPVATGSFSTDNAASQTQFTYLDVGMNFDATVNSVTGGVALKSKVEQSSIGPTNTIAGVAEPVVRQSVLDGSSIVPLGKPLMLGSIDIPNSTRRLDVDVMVEPIK